MRRYLKHYIVIMVHVHRIRARARILFLFFVVSSLCIYNWPYLTGDLGVSYTGKFYNVELTSKPSLVEAINWVQCHRESEGFFRTLWLPWDQEMSDSLRWRDPYFFDAPRLGYYGSDISLFIKYTMDMLYANETRNIGVLLGQAGVKYIIVYLDSLYRDGSYPTGDPNDLPQILDQQEDLELVVSTPSYLIYENKDFKSQVTVYNQMIPIRIGESNVTVEATDKSVTFGFEEWTGLPEGWTFLSHPIGIIARSSSVAYGGHYSLELTSLSMAYGVALVSPPLIVDPDNVTLSFSVYIPKGQKICADQVYVVFYYGSWEQVRYYLATDSSTHTDRAGANLNNLPIDQWLNFAVDVDDDWNKLYDLPPKMPVYIALVNNLERETQPPATVYFDNVSVSSSSVELYTSTSVNRYPILSAAQSLPNLNVSNTFFVVEGEKGLSSEDFEYIYNQSSSISIVLGNDPSRLPANKQNLYLIPVASEEPLPLYESAKVPFDFYAPQDGLYKFALNGLLSPNSVIYIDPLAHSDDEVSPIVLCDDNQSSFWSTYGSGVGSIEAGLSDDTQIKLSGMNSLKMSIGPGSYSTIWLYHKYFPPKNWSSKDLMSLYWYGANTGKPVHIVAHTIIDASYFVVTFTDDWTGWKRVVLYMKGFEKYGSPDPTWSNITKIEVGIISSEQGTWYLDRCVVDEKPLHYTLTAFKEEWYQTDAIFLTQGKHEIVVENQGKTVDKLYTLAAFMAETEDVNIDDLFGQINDNVNASLTKISNTEYKIDLETQRPVVISLAESYHPYWYAQVEGQKTMHFEAYGWANGFYFGKAGSYSIEIVYRGQAKRNLILSIWALSWISLITGICVTSRTELRTVANYMTNFIKKLERYISRLLRLYYRNPKMQKFGKG